MNTLSWLAFVVAAHASRLDLTWDQCDDTNRVKINSVTPTTVSLGSSTTITARGHAYFPIEVGTCIFAVVKAGHIPILHCGGLVTVTHACTLPLGAGTVTLNALGNPANLPGVGPISFSFVFDLAASLPSQLRSTTTHVTVEDTFAIEFLCLDLKLGSNDNDCGMHFDVVSHTVSNQGKFAVWHAELEAIFYVDSPAFTPAWDGGIVRAYKPSNGITYEVYRSDTFGIGSVMPRKSGGIVLAMTSKNSHGETLNQIFTMDVNHNTFRGGNLVHQLDLPIDTKGKWNNGNCDAAGRLWLGTFEYQREWQHHGKVWVVERTASGVHAKVGIDNIGHPNGLVWNGDGTQLLFSRTYKNAVYKYKYDLASGAVSDPVQLVWQPDNKTDLYDSMCGFEDGSFLVTEPGFWRMKHFNADGSLKCVQKLPGQSQRNFVASCAFGNGDLYVPTGRNGGGNNGPDGWVFRVKDVAGGIVSHACDI